MIKIAMIGAGSVVFSKNLTTDILSYPEFRGANFSYMDIAQDRLEVGVNLCRKIAKAIGANPRIETTYDRREALRDADFVVNMVQIGGFNSTLVDFEIPRKYGLRFTIADTTGPGGIFRALRTYTMLKGLCQDMTELCPRAILLNYSNPMSMNMQTVARTSDVRAVGFCHSVQGTLKRIMGYIKIPPEEVAFTCAGINHMAFYLKLEHRGQDLYPRLFEAMDHSEIYKNDRVRFELMRRLGYFVTESSEHNAEYCPYFIPHGQESIRKYDVPINEYLRRCDNSVGEFEQMKLLSTNEQPIDLHRSEEYGSTVIHSVVTGEPSVVYGNMPNRGAISNLPATAIVEAPNLVDRNGLTFATVGELPPQLVGYMQPHIAQHELFIRAATEGRRDHIYQAAMFDPLTAATLSIDKIVEMCDELIAAHGELLPDLDAKKTLVATSGKRFGPADFALMQKSWRDVKANAAEEYFLDWRLIGPFKSETVGEIDRDSQAPAEQGWLGGDDGSIDLGTPYQFAGERFQWRRVIADTNTGRVNFADVLGHVQQCIGYAYTEIESAQPRETTLRYDFDNGVKIWLNGKIVKGRKIKHDHNSGPDEASVSLKGGKNCILVKFDHRSETRGFNMSIVRSHS